jgi:hypothetical protein
MEKIINVVGVALYYAGRLLARLVTSAIIIGGLSGGIAFWLFWWSLSH